MDKHSIDVLYLIFFLIHLPVMLLVDLVPLYPSSLSRGPLSQLRAWYVRKYADAFFTDPPAWFTFYTWIEAVYHVPVSIWAIGAILKNNPKMPLHLLVFACQTFLSTITCVIDIVSWEEINKSQKLSLCGLYVPYALLAMIMGVDMFGRLSQMVNDQSPPKSKTL